MEMKLRVPVTRGYFFLLGALRLVNAGSLRNIDQKKISSGTQGNSERAKWVLVIFLTCQICDLRLACLKVIGASLQTIRVRACIKSLAFKHFNLRRTEKVKN